MKRQALKRGAILFACGVALLAGYLGLRGHTRAAPEVTFVSLQGERIATSSLKGKVAIVNFWATSCIPCRKEMPALVQTYERYRARGLELIAVAMRYDPPDRVLDYAERNALPFKVALDPLGDIARAFGNVQVTPTMVVIDKRGRMLEYVEGEPDFHALHRLIEGELAGDG